MDGCPACEQGKTWNTCTEPLLVLARMCYGEGALWQQWQLIFITREPASVL